MRKICVVITARPSYARIQTVLEALYANPTVEPLVVMAGAALLHHYGQVETDCPYPIAARIYSTLDGNNHVTTATETGLLTIKLAQLFHDMRPDLVVTIADRHETLATAMAASYQHIPLAHIHRKHRRQGTGCRVDARGPALPGYGTRRETTTREGRAWPDPPVRVSVD
jgi:GDP/UDP-N,N'-diacetylbacillosamine 2-epimerase (hydrolysing)